MDNLGAGQGRLIGASAVVSVPGGRRDGRSLVFLYPRRGMQALLPCGGWGQNKEKTTSQSNSQSWEQSCRALAVLSAGG